MFKKISNSIKPKIGFDKAIKRVEVFSCKVHWKLINVLKPKIVRSAYGPKFYSNFDDATFHFYMRGSYGNFLSNCLSSIQQPFIFIDIGANQGLYSLIAEKNPNCKAIYAFEPVPQTYKMLMKNIALNRANKIRVLNYAISDTTGDKEIYFDLKHTGGASIEHQGSGSVIEKISCISSKDIANLLMLQDGLDIFVKIDTEGHEPIVVSELRKTPFWDCVKQVFFEADDGWYDSAAVIKLLESDGFMESGRTEINVVHYDVLMTRTRVGWKSEMYFVQ